MQEPKIVDLPRKMERADRRRVRDAIEDNYPEPERGYAKGVDDESIARKLGVPRIWVKEVREAEFGPEVDVNIAALKADLEKIQIEFRLIEDSTINRVAELSKRVEAAIKTHDALRSRLK